MWPNDVSSILVFCSTLFFLVSVSMILHGARNTASGILETFILLSFFIIAMYVHHLSLYCILFRRFLIAKINVALQLTKVMIKESYYCYYC